MEAENWIVGKDSDGRKQDSGKNTVMEKKLWERTKNYGRMRRIVGEIRVVGRKLNSMFFWSQDPSL